MAPPAPTSATSPRRFEAMLESEAALRDQVASDTAQMIVAAMNTATECGNESKFWVPSSDPAELWELVRVVRPGAKEGTMSVSSAEDGGERERDVCPTVAHPHDATHDEDLDDVCGMADLHEAPLLNLLRRRWREDAVYTAAGNVLISINPYRQLKRDFYEVPRSFDDMRRRFGRNPDDEPPHLYRWAHRAYEALCAEADGGESEGQPPGEKLPSQAIIVSGESGAGKTTASTLLIEYLANLSRAQRREERGGPSASWDATTLVATTPVLEAFGNAKTAMNDNSSRFGKFVLLDYAHAEGDGRRGGPALAGAHVEDFLLEKSRVAHCGPKERNFHFFYQLCATGDMSGPEHHGYLNQQIMTIDGVDDRADAAAAADALRAVGFSEEECAWLRRVGRAVVRLGDLDFDDDFVDGEDEAIVVNKGALQDVADCLGILAEPDPSLQKKRRTLSPEEQMSYRQAALESKDDDDDDAVKQRRESDDDDDEASSADARPTLIEALHHRSIKVAGAKKLIPYTAQQATQARDALAKALYERLFSHVVQKCNVALRGGADDDDDASLPGDPADGDTLGRPRSRGAFIGILDIYGFEIFAENANSLDQLLINYANESLQVSFNRDVLVAETDRYRREGIEWAGVDLQDSRACLDLIARPPNGILVQLDEQVKLGARGSDLDFLGCIDKLHLGGPKKPNPFYSKPRFEREAFTIHHFADAVTYSAHGFLKRNVDPLSTDLAEVVQSSRDAIIQQWYPPPPRGEGARQALRRTLTESTSKKFREQMARLNAELAECRKHYVRCVRPNAAKKPDVSHMELVLQQLRYFGLLDIVRIRRLGFPERKKLLVFWNAYWRLAPDGPGDDRWQAFRDLLPPRTFRREPAAAAAEEDAYYAAYRRALPAGADWRAWASKREPLLVEVDALEEGRLAAAKVNDQAKIGALTAAIDGLKARLADPEGEFAPPDVEKAVVMLCSTVLEADEYAVGQETGQLYSKLGVTQRLDEMLAKSMGVELVLASRRRAQLSQLVSERVNAEAAATLQLQKLARAQAKLRDYQQSKRAAKLLEKRARVLLAKREADRLRDARVSAYTAARDRARDDVEAFAARHVATCDLIDSVGLADDADVVRRNNAANAALVALKTCVEDAADLGKASSPLEKAKAAVDDIAVLVGVAREAVDDAWWAARDLARARSAAAVQALASGLEDARAFADACFASPLGGQQDATSGARARADLDAAAAAPRDLIENLKFRVFKEGRAATLGEVRAAEAALFALDHGVRSTYLAHLAARIGGLDARHGAVVAEAARARVESRDDVKTAVTGAQRALGAARAAVDADRVVAAEEFDDGTRAAVVVRDGAAATLEKHLLGPKSDKYRREYATKDLVDAAERDVRAEEDLFEATAKTRAFSDLAEGRAQRGALLAKAARAAGGGVEGTPEVAAVLGRVDAALAEPTTGLSGAALVAVADAAEARLRALTAAVDAAYAAAEAATRLEATFRARRDRKAHARRVEAVTTLGAAARRGARRRSFHLKKENAVVLETALRGFAARAQFASALKKRSDGAATKLQTWWRCALAKACLKFVQRLSAPWKGVLPSKHEFVVCATAVVWHRYTNMGRMGEVVGSRKLNLIVTNKGNVLFASGGAYKSGVSVYNPEATPAVVRVMNAARHKTVITLPDLVLSPSRGAAASVLQPASPSGSRRSLKKLPAGREQPAIIVDADVPPVHTPVTRFDIKMKKGVRTVKMHLTDLAGTYARWQFLKDIFDARDWTALTPKCAMRLNLDESIANLPIDVCGFVYKSPFKRRGQQQQQKADNLRPASVAKQDSIISEASEPSSPRTSAKRTVASRLATTIEATGIKHEEKERFFILQGGLLRYFKHEADDVPKGQLCLPVVGGVASEATIDLGPDHLQFTVKTAAFPEGITMRAHDKAELNVWRNAIEAAIKTDLKQKSRMILQKKKSPGEAWMRDPGSPRSPTSPSYD